MSAVLEGILDAAYAAVDDDERWLERLLIATRPVLDGGLGVIGFFYDRADTDAPRLRAPVFLGAPQGTREALERLLLEAPRPLVRSLHRLVPSCTTMSDRLGLGAELLELPVHRALFAPLGIADLLAVAGSDESGAGCLIGAPLPRVTSMATLDVELLTSVAAHVAAGMGMRSKRGGAANQPPPGPVWAALVAGRWAVMDSFDRGGARFLLARKRGSSRPPADVEASLTSREREVVWLATKGHSNKLIGDELGIAASTVAGHLAKASAKLGVTSRVALMKAFLGSR